MRICLVKSTLFASGLLILSGCAGADPLYMSDRWNLPSANSRNLVLQVAEPSDLRSGRSDPTYDATLAANAVKRLRDGKIKKIESTAVTQIGNSQSGGGGGGS